MTGWRCSRTTVEVRKVIRTIRKSGADTVKVYLDGEGMIESDLRRAVLHPGGGRRRADGGSGPAIISHAARRTR